MTSANQASNGTHVIILPFKLEVHRLKICLEVFATILLVFLLTINCFNHVAYGESAKAYLLMTPPACIAKEIGELFDVAINISSVENLRSVGFTVTYNASLLNVEQIAEGSFFPAPPRSYFEFENNASVGFIKVNMSLAGSETPKNGNGTLAWISFEVVHGPELCVSSPLEFKQILLLDSALAPIAHDSVGAVYLWKSMQPDPPVNGRSLDVYTQRAGVGSDEPGGEFESDEIVYMISRVMYNGDAVQRKLVAFEIQNPFNEIVVIRTAVTSQSGLAAISFRIPNIPTSNGTWRAISVVEIGEKTVWDTISFQVYLRIPVGGYTSLIKGYTREGPLILYPATVAILAVTFTIIKSKTHRRLRRCTKT